MAGIAGIYCADGRPADVAELRRMVAPVAHRGANGITYWNSGPVAVAHLQFHTTPESLHERQPLVSPGGEVCLVWNGRLDNREELLAELATRGAVPVDETDAGIVLAAYYAWGTDCVQHIVGDFALAIWDAPQRRLWCARDYIGIRPFYYFWDGKTFLFAPEIRSLLAHPAVSLKINEGMAGEFLANAITNRDETLYTDIRRLPSGKSLAVANGNLKIDTWWRPDLGLLKYRSDDEYAEHFRHLFDQSISHQIRCNTAWGIELSGGLDSSSIAVSARAVLDNIGEQDARVLTFSVTAPDSPWDESEDIAAVVKKASLTSEMVPPLLADLDFFGHKAHQWRDYPGAPNGEPMTIPMYDAAKRQGARVLLTGIGGDEWLDGRPENLIDLAARLKMRELLDRAKVDWETYSGDGHWPVYLARRLMAAALPDRLYVQRRKRRLSNHGLLSEQFVRRTGLIERIFVPHSDGRHFASRAQRAIFDQVISGAEAHIFEWNDRESACAGMELRFPFFDRRLTEFCLRLPEHQRQQGAVWKLMLRNAMRERLPDRIRMKTRKAEFSELFDRIFYTPKAKMRLQNLSIRKKTDWLDPRKVEKHLAAAAQTDGSFSLGPWPLWRLLAIDLWIEDLASENEKVSASGG